MLLALIVILGLVACAHPQGIRVVSKEQEALLVNFKTALDDVRVRVRTAFDESIADYKEARLRQWVLTETGFLSTRILRCRQGALDCQGKGTKDLLDEAAEYLARGRATLFADFCAPTGGWQSVSKAWMKRQNERCPARPGQVVHLLERLRDTLDANLRRLAEDMISVQEAHAIIDQFLQIRIEIQQEDVAAAQQVIAKATTAVQDAKAAMASIRGEVPR
jgi:hypothetical protein